METIIIILTFILAIATKAGGDALRYRCDTTHNNEERAELGVKYHILHTLQVIILIVGMSFVKLDYLQIIYYLFIYALYNYAIFDLLFNVFGKKDLFYVGNTAYWDRLIRKYVKGYYIFLYWLSKLIIFLFVSFLAIYKLLFL